HRLGEWLRGLNEPLGWARRKVFAVRALFAAAFCLSVGFSSVAFALSILSVVGIAFAVVGFVAGAILFPLGICFLIPGTVNGLPAGFNLLGQSLQLIYI